MYTSAFSGWRPSLYLKYFYFWMPLYSHLSWPHLSLVLLPLLPPHSPPLLHSELSTGEVRNANCFLSTGLTVAAGHATHFGQHGLNKDLLWGFQESFSLLKREKFGWCHLLPSHPHPSFFYVLNVTVVSVTVVDILWPWYENRTFKKQQNIYTERKKSSRN